MDASDGLPGAVMEPVSPVTVFVACMLELPVSGADGNLLDKSCTGQPTARPPRRTWPAPAPVPSGMFP